MTAADYTDPMRDALVQATIARDAGDHPYGTTLVGPDGVINERNRVESNRDVTAHSEIMAIRVANKQWGLDLSDVTLVTTGEPCPMCAGAIVAAGITNVVIAQRREVGAAPFGDYTVESLLSLFGRAGEITVTGRVLGDEVDAFYADLES